MNCPECDRPRLWSGMGWAEHTDGQHALYRHTLLSAIARQLLFAGGVRDWQLDCAIRQSVGIRWRCGVYPGQQSELRTRIPYEVWDAENPDDVLRWLREGNTWKLKAQHGVNVNPATWFHKIYDGRQT